MGGAHHKFMNTYYGKFEYKEMLLLGLQITQTRHPLRISDGKVQLP